MVAEAGWDWAAFWSASKNLANCSGEPSAVMSSARSAVRGEPAIRIAFGPLDADAMRAWWEAQGPDVPPQDRAFVAAFAEGSPGMAVRAAEHGIATTIPERDDQIAHRRKKPGRPIDFGEAQRERYKGRNVVERCFNKLKQWRGIATRYDKHNLNYRGGAVLNAIFLWLKRLWDRP